MKSCDLTPQKEPKLTKRCPGKCGRMLHTDDRMCSGCRSKLSYRQRVQLDSGVDINTILITAYGTSNHGDGGASSSGGGGYSGGDSGGGGGGDCG